MPLAASAVVLDCSAVLCREVGGAEGIVNGMDVTEWNPKTDKYLPVKYDRNTVFEGKAAAKAALQAEMGLPVDPTAPLFGYIGRLEEQKGVDILLAVSGAVSSAVLCFCYRLACGHTCCILPGTGVASAVCLVGLCFDPKSLP